MIIGGLEKFSLIDFPKHLSAIVFTKGCNFRCQFCYNPMLVVPERENGFEKDRFLDSEKSESIKESDLFVFLESRIGKLDAVVITGGEPLLHNDLEDFIIKIRKMGFKIKLDTNGTSPEKLKNLIEKGLLDYIAMDIKGPKEKYVEITGVNIDLKDILESIIIIMESGVDYEFRTTVAPSMLEPVDIEKMGEMIKGAKKWYLQPFKSDTELINNKYKNTLPYKDDEMEEMKKRGEKYVELCEVR